MSAVRLHVDASAPTARAAADALPLVLLHGWGMNLRAFDPLRAALDDVATLAIDLPGHGRSPWWPQAASFDVLCAAVLEALPPRCHLLGWSLGAKVALSLAATHPLRIATLTLVAATPKFARAPDWPHGMADSAMRAFRTVLEQDWRGTLDDFIELQVRGTRQAEEVARSLSSALLDHGAPHRDALLAGMTLLERTDLRALVPDIEPPALVIAGRNDRVTPPGAAEWLAATLPRASLELVPRTGHAPHLSHAAGVAQRLQRFMATCHHQESAA
jgi:pimeloyl-[acyl-carrier protein] methyl ester esterase